MAAFKKLFQIQRERERTYKKVIYVKQMKRTIRPTEMFCLADLFEKKKVLNIRTDICSKQL